MKIVKVDRYGIYFDNGAEITSDFDQCCYEYNYAEFEYLKDDKICLNTDFKEPLIFEKTGDYGFRFGNKPLKMFYVPCYSEQNGCYDNSLRILYNDKIVLDKVEAEMIDG